MDIVDFQLHEPGPRVDWSDVSEDIKHRALTEMLLQMMESVGVTSVLLHPTREFQWAEGLSEKYPSTFSSVPMLHGDRPENTSSGVGPELSPDDPDIEESIAAVAARPAVRTIRFVPGPLSHPQEFVKFTSGGYDRALAACQKQDVPVLIHLWGGVSALEPIARRYPDLQFIVDHLGIPQPPHSVLHDPWWKDFPAVLTLAELDNVAIKLCGAPGLSSEGYPFRDSWKYVEQLLESYGVQRLAWGSDISRFRGRVGWNIRFPKAAEGYLGMHTYAESLGFILHSDQLSIDEKEHLLGRTARRLLRWPLDQTALSP